MITKSGLTYSGTTFVRTHLFNIRFEYPLTFTHLPPTWRTLANRHDQTHSFMFAAMSTLGKCTYSLVFDQTLVKPSIHKRAEWFANHSRMVYKPNACMCGWDCEPVLRHLWTVRIPFAVNQNLLVFCANTKRTGCASMHQVSSACLRFVEN